MFYEHYPEASAYAKCGNRSNPVLPLLYCHYTICVAISLFPITIQDPDYHLYSNSYIAGGLDIFKIIPFLLNMHCFEDNSNAVCGSTFRAGEVSLPP